MQVTVWVGQVLEDTVTELLREYSPDCRTAG